MRRQSSPRLAGSADQTERTWRPAYWPQFGQAWCGGFRWAQARVGARESDRARAFHCDRRARVLARAIFRFGTATSVLLWVVCCLVVAGVRRRSETAGEPGPAGIEHLVRVVRRQVVEPLAAVDAQSRAVLRADRRQRQGQDD